MTPGWRGRRPGLLRRPAEGECDKPGKSPGPSPLDGELGLLQERHSFPTSFVLRLVLFPGAKLVAKNNWEQMLVQHPAAI